MSSVCNIELQTLGLQDLYRLQQEFIEIFEMMMENSVKQLRAAWIMKLDAMQKCHALQEQIHELDEGESVNLSANSLKKRAKKNNYNIDIRNLGQIDEMEESCGSSSSENEDPKSEKGSPSVSSKSHS